MKRLILFIFAVSLIGTVSCKKIQETNAKGVAPGTKHEETAPETKKNNKMSDTEKNTQQGDAALAPPIVDDVGDPTELAVIETEKGNIALEFYPDVAPMHVANFKNLARAGFYDGTTFHRVIPGFVIQGGDPNTKNDNPHDDGMGGPPYRVKAEFSDRPHEKYTLSMARGGDPNSAGSQFFICLDRVSHLDNKYTVFGKAVKGRDIVDAIGAMRRDPSSKYDRELPAVKMKRVYIIDKSELDKVK